VGPVIFEGVDKDGLEWIWEIFLAATETLLLHTSKVSAGVLHSTYNRVFRFNNGATSGDYPLIDSLTHLAAVATAVRSSLSAA
jgi:hypothetical protein